MQNDDAVKTETLGTLPSSAGEAVSDAPKNPPTAQTEATAKDAPAQQASQKSPEPEIQKTNSKHKTRYTTGEKIYDQVNFWIVKGAILAATAAIALPLKFGAETNPLRKAGAKFIDKIAKPIAGLGEKFEGKIGGGLGKKVGQMFIILGYGLANSVFLWFGGTATAPLVRSFENHRKELIHKWNEKWGKPGDVEIADEKFKDLPKQTWGDILKGRMAAWATVFGSFIVAYPLIGMSKKAPKAFRLDYFEEVLGRWGAKLSGKTAKLIENVPMSKADGALNELQEVAHAMPELAKDKSGMFRYRLFKILALDVYATSAAIIVWNFTSRLSAMAREHGVGFFTSLKERGAEAIHHKKPHDAPAPVAEKKEGTEKKDETKTETQEPAALSKSFSNRMESPAGTHVAAAENRKGSGTQIAVV